MPLFPQTRKTISFHCLKVDGFLLVDAPAPSPGEQSTVLDNTAWISGCAIENRYRERKNLAKNFVEGKRVKITRQLILTA